jgi:hypothetical protein
MHDICDGAGRPHLRKSGILPGFGCWRGPGASLPWPFWVCRICSGVDFGARADRTDASDAAARYTNKRAEMWGFLKE